MKISELIGDLFRQRILEFNETDGYYLKKGGDA